MSRTAQLLSEIDPIEEQLAVLETSVTNIAERLDRVEHAMVGLLKQVLANLTLYDKKTGAERVRRALAHVAGIYPKSRNVIFVGRNFFGDNIKYAYLVFCERQHGRSEGAYFLTEDARQHAMLIQAGLPCLPPALESWTAEEFKIVLSARTAVLGDYLAPHYFRNPAFHILLQGKTLVQLWHGMPMKKTALQTVAPFILQEPNTVETAAAAGPFDIFVGSHAAMRETWAQQFAFRDYAVLGSPRNDVLFGDVSDKSMLNVDVRFYREAKETQKAGGAVILYTPACRKDGAGWFDHSGISAFAEHCRMRGHLFAISLHPADAGNAGDLYRRYPDIRFIEPLTDIYPLLRQIGVLIVDYSSLAFDFLLLDRPLVFFRPNHDDYVRQWQGVIPERMNMTPGEVVNSSGHLIKAAEAAIAMYRKPETDLFHPARMTLRQTLFEHTDGQAGERLHGLIKNELAKPK